MLTSGPLMCWQAMWLSGSRPSAAACRCAAELNPATANRSPLCLSSRRPGEQAAPLEAPAAPALNWADTRPFQHLLRCAGLTRTCLMLLCVPAQVVAALENWAKPIKDAALRAIDGNQSTSVSQVSARTPAAVSGHSLRLLATAASAAVGSDTPCHTLASHNHCDYALRLTPGLRWLKTRVQAADVVAVCPAPPPARLHIPVSRVEQRGCRSCSATAPAA